MTGNGIESDFVLPDSLFISDYSTLPAFYPHFGANCRFFCTISMSPDSSTLFCSPNAGPPPDARNKPSYGYSVSKQGGETDHGVLLSAFSRYARVMIGERRKGRCPLTPPKGLRPSGLPFARFS